MGFILINLFFLLIAFFALIILWWVWPPDSPWSPWWRTTGKKAEAAARLCEITDKDTVYELGSGDATFLVIATKKFGAIGIGVEIDPIRHLTAWLNIRKNKVKNKITLKKDNFFNINLSHATVVFIYLVPKVLERLKPKLFAELKRGTKIISYKYKFDIKENEPMKLISKDSENEMYLYRIG